VMKLFLGASGSWKYYEDECVSWRENDENIL